jgi:hypothetical protein
MGNRVNRTDYTGSSPVTTYYVYDAGGNSIALYADPTETELSVYGTDRLGTYTVAGGSYVYG